MNEVIPKLDIGTNEAGRVWLPAIPSEKAAVIGVSGSGKSYLVGHMAEEWLMAGTNIAILDPVGIHWGLRTSFDGDPEGGMPIYIFGGARGDAELEEPWTAATEWAIGRRPTVFDLSRLTYEWVHWWTAEFIKKLGELGPSIRTPAHLIVEEAPVFGPQSGSLSRYQRDCKSALAQYARVYRNFGLGMTVVAQRAAAVDKNTLTQCGTIFAMRLAADLDRRTIRDWVASNSASIDVEKALNELSTMAVGNGLLWAPTWGESENRYARFKGAARSTFHPDPRDLYRNRTVVLRQMECLPQKRQKLNYRPILQGALTVIGVAAGAVLAAILSVGVGVSKGLLTRNQWR